MTSVEGAPRSSTRLTTMFGARHRSKIGRYRAPSAPNTASAAQTAAVKDRCVLSPFMVPLLFWDRVKAVPRRHHVSLRSRRLTVC
jgi:hypothetical protein